VIVVISLPLADDRPSDRCRIRSIRLLIQVDSFARLAG
jgi:hypothetical protein